MDAEAEFEAALAAWVDERAVSLAEPEVLTREEALRRLAAEALRGMGLLPVR